MPRIARIAPGGIIYHVLNRGVGKMTLFRSARDYEAFQRCLVQTLETTPTRILAYCVMSNHWHLVLWPERDDDLARFMLRLTIRHVRRWIIHRQDVGRGHVYQGRYKSFAMSDDDHLATVCRYVERNPVRAGIVKSCQDWPWSSAGQHALDSKLQIALTRSPIPWRRDWVDWTNQPQTAAEEAAVLRCIHENRPFGSDKWLDKFRKELGWREPLPHGRPPKKGKGRESRPI